MDVGGRLEMTVVERRRRILEILKAKKKMSIGDLSKILGTSEITVRRDIKVLEHEGKVIRSRGIVFLPDLSEYELSFMEREKENVKLKVSIAREAMNFIKDGMLIGLDAGTTTLQIARQIVERKISVTVVTPCLPILQLMSRSGRSEVILIGGKYDVKNLSFVGPVTNRALNMFRFDLCFIGASAVIPEKGFFTSDLEGAEVVRQLARNSSKIIGVVDSSKFRRSAQYLSVDITDIDILITDDGVSEALLKKIPQKVRVILSRR